MRQFEQRGRRGGEGLLRRRERCLAPPHPDNLVWPWHADALLFDPFYDPADPYYHSNPYNRKCGRGSSKRGRGSSGRGRGGCRPRNFRPTTTIMMLRSITTRPITALPLATMICKNKVQVDAQE